MNSFFCSFFHIAANGLEEYNVPDSIFLPTGVDLRQVTVLPKAEWVRIRDSVDSAAREAARIHAERKERKDMHLRSKAVVKNWPNTIAVSDMYVWKFEGYLLCTLEHSECTLSLPSQCTDTYTHTHKQKLLLRVSL